MKAEEWMKVEQGMKFKREMNVGGLTECLTVNESWLMNER